MRKKKLLSTLLLSLSAGVASGQQEQGLICHFGYEDQFLPIPTETASENESPVDVKANRVQLLQNGTSVFSGNVDILRDNQLMSAERATYNRNSGDVRASGNVSVRDSEMVIESEQAEWSVANDQGQMLNAQYHIRQMHARGEAAHILRKGQKTTDLDDATYTTCPEGSDAWQLKADTVHLDHETAVGEAKNVVVRMGGWPVFYTPYINFPLNDQRKSGFLIPSVGSSDKTGFDVLTPYYWNIAPNMDATLTPRYMSDRGLMLGGQFRYLFESGEGEVEATYLNSDDLQTNGEDINPHYQEDRKLFSWQHRSYFDNRWRAIVDYNYVSDDEYFEDFGSGLSLSSRTYLNRNVETGYSGDIWSFTARAQGYQTLGDDVEEQYKRLPQLVLKGYLPDQALGLTYELDSEYVEFDHNEKVDGQRINIEPAISMPMGTAAFFATPRLALNHTQYSLKNDNTNTYDDSATRTLPIASFDTGLFFDREMTAWGDNYIQTLEPRAFYLYVPERDQTDIPDFDTSLTTFNSLRLFSHNRFIGRDRIGDANQLTLAVTSRIIDEESGKENLRLTLGQIRYFTDQRVMLDGTIAERDSTSDMVAEAVAYIGDEWSFNSEFQWDPSGLKSNMSSVGLRYKNDSGGIFNISHRYRRDDPTPNNGIEESLEQIDISTQIPLSERWKFFGRWYHAIDQGETLEKIAGLQYDSCCWATRLVMRDYVNDVSDQERNTAIYLQIELKGLGSFGQKSDSLLERSIRGFEAE
mgnify:CR=1 FL=1